MGAAAYSRGSAIGSREADGEMPVARARAAQAAEREHEQGLRARITALERDLTRARRCIAELRRSREARLLDARSEANSSAAAIRILCRLAFPGDPADHE